MPVLPLPSQPLLKPGPGSATFVSEKEFDEICGRLERDGVAYGSGPNAPANGQINTRRGGRWLYFVDRDGHLMEIMTTPE